MIGNEVVIEFFNMTAGTIGRHLLFAGSVVAGCAILVLYLNMSLVSEDDFATFVLKEDSNRRAFGVGGNQVSRKSGNKKNSSQYGDGQITSLQ